MSKCIETGVYFANFLKIYEEIKQDNQLYVELPDGIYIYNVSFKRKTNIRPKISYNLIQTPFFY